MAAPQQTRQKLTDVESTFALLIGTGLILMMLSFMLTAAQGIQVGRQVPNMLLVAMFAGLGLLIIGSIAWFMATRPQKYFDDWSTPLYTGHDHAAEAHAEVSHEEVSHADRAIAQHLDTSTPVMSTDEAVYDYAGPEAIAAETLMTQSSAPVEPDVLHMKVVVEEDNDLERIEGIGKKIANALRNAGVVSFEDIAQRTPEELEYIVRSAGVRMVGNAATWPQQAALAAKNSWDELNAYQQQLRHGH